MTQFDLETNFICNVKIGDHLLASNCWCIVNNITEVDEIKTLKLYVVNGGFHMKVSCIIPLHKIFIYSEKDNEESELFNFNLQKWKPGLYVPFHFVDYVKGLQYLESIEL